MLGVRFESVFWAYVAAGNTRPESLFESRMIREKISDNANPYNKPPPLTSDDNKDPNIKALRRRGLVSHGSTLSLGCLLLLEETQHQLKYPKSWDWGLGFRA